ncbi:MAG TPA: polysaccharide deacetylase family protein, partial [Conexibacter sp.]|nr:polysaccharide deacetylase family protein [Conexibacter sp.]
MPRSSPPPYHRRRLLALGGLVAALAAVAVAVVAALGAGGDSSGHGPSAQVTQERGGATPAGRPTGTTPAATTTSPAGPARDMGSPGPPRPVPILMYHVVSAPFPDSPYPDLYVPKEELADQMDALADAGYTAVTLREVWDAWHEGGPLPRRPVVVSFDDGYRSHLTHALPVLRAHGWPGVLNLELKNIRSDYGLTEPQVRELLDAGWELDSHTIDHPDLTTVDAATLEREVAESRRQLRERFGVPVDFFCYPAGRYDETVIAAVERAGYLAATTTNPGLAQPDEADRFEL